MSRISKAETALVGKLEESRQYAAAVQALKPKYTPKSEERNDPAATSGSQKRVKPPKPPLDNDEDARAVLNLDVPRFDSTRKFEGIERQKMAKKDRHMKALDEFSKTLDIVSEDIEQQVLFLSREIRENLEMIDDNIRQKYLQLTDDNFLVKQTTEQLDEELQLLKTKTAERSKQVEKFASDLENIECSRAENVGGKIRALVDLLVSIAHQLPDEIEHTVESETFDLNAVVTANRNSHAELLGIMRTKQIEIEIVALHNWDVAKQQWRRLRHDQSIKTFHADIFSEEYVAPSDRQAFMDSVRLSQKERHEARQKLLDDLKTCTADTISSKEVKRVKESLAELNEQEITATQDCYNGLSSLRASLRGKAERRMENLRKELHRYGALHPEPPLSTLSDSLKAAISDATVAELLRLSGGLKPELAAVAADFVSEDIVYEKLLGTTEVRLDLVCAGFSLRDVMAERGRLPRLESTRTTLSKLRTVPRAEVAALLTSLLPDLRDATGYEKMPPTFLRVVSECVDAIDSELARVQENIDHGFGTEDRMNSRQSGMERGSLGGSVGHRDSKADLALSKTATGTTTKSSTTRKKRISTMSTGTTRAAIPENVQLTTADPLLVKQWTRQLSMLYFASDLPDTYKALVAEAMVAVQQARICNTKVDAVVFAECDAVLNDLDKRYKLLVDLIANFLEVQANALSFSSNKVTDFFVKIAKVMESHKAKQVGLDDASLDLLWDYSEENRFACEDREAEYEKLCQALRRSADMDKLKSNFEAILSHLASILEGYRSYHGQACFLADKHPLSLIDDYVDHMQALCELFHMTPLQPHLIVESKEKLHRNNQRLNRKYLDPSELPPEEEQSLQDQDDLDTLEEPLVTEEGANLSATSSKANSPRASPRVSPRLQTSPPKQKEVEQPSPYVEVFTIPVPITRTVDPTREIADELSCECEYGLHQTFDQFVIKFVDEAAAIAAGEVDDEDDGAALLANSSSEDRMSEDGLDRIVATKVDRVHPELPWIVIRGYEPNSEDMEMKSLLTPQELSQMSEYDINAYEDWILKHFVPRGELETFDVAPVAEETEDEKRVRKGKAAALKEAYTTTLNIVQRAKERKANQSDPNHLLQIIPKDSNGHSFVSRMEISSAQVSALLVGIRASVFTHLEVNCDSRIVAANELNKKRKTELTEQLEDLLRTHWPRCGLVETQIKRPREVELLSHEEKTYRFILSIQEKMASLQNLFDDTVAQTRTTCGNFREQLSSLLVVLTETHYKTLAALQGVEVKARAATQAFHAAGSAYLTSLRKMVAEDASAIIVYARDFRKICPPQSDGVAGGYSESELQDIGRLVDGQCAEISEVLEDWRSTILELEKQLADEEAKHETFTQSFEEVAAELALSQGLGQKFGAPRRRAQEKLRTEISRDEKSAGQVDELLAQLEFQCAEAVGKYEARSTQESMICKLLQGKELFVSAKGTEHSNGFEELHMVENMWALAVRVRDSLHVRAKYLEVFSEEDPSGKLEPAKLSWPPIFERFPDLPIGQVSPLKLHQIIDTTCLSAVVDDVEKTCKLETQELYKIEGKEDMLNQTPEGIPESLSIWLRDARLKIWGPSGHREKSWKRLWGQVDKFEALLARKSGPLDQPQSKVGVPAACFRMLAVAYEQYLTQQVDQKVEQFSKLLKIWEKGKDKHDRQLRPRLGSPDAQDELAQLDAIESQRSEEVRLHVEQIQSSLIAFVVHFSKIFCNDLGDCAKSYFNLLDSSLRLELLRIPPDTEVPKKKMTMKRLRKAQRVKEEIQKGNEDVSVERVWPSLTVDRLVDTLRSVESLVLLPDLTKLSPPPPVDEVVEDAKKKKPPPPQSKKGKEVVVAVEEEKVAPPSTPPLIAEAWIQEVKTKSAVRAAVSTGHRLLVSERDASLEKFTNHINVTVNENKLYYGKILQQEHSWNQRWRNQVDMLKAGEM